MNSSILQVLSVLCCLCLTQGSFLFNVFNETTGLVFVGSAGEYILTRLFLKTVGVILDTELFITKPWSCSALHTILSINQSQ